MAGRRPPAVAAGAPASADVGTRVSDMVPRRKREREAGEACEGDTEDTGGRGALTGLTVGQGSHEIHAHGTRGARCSHQKATGSRACWGRMRPLRVESEQRCRSCSNRPGGAPHQRRADNLRRPNTTARALLLSRRRSWRKCVRRRLWKKKGALGKRRRTSGGPVVCVRVPGPARGLLLSAGGRELAWGLPPRRLFRNAYSGMHAMGKKERRTTDAATPLSLHIPEPRAGPQSCPACAQVPAEVAALAGMQTKYVTVADVKRQEPELPCTSDAGRPRTTQSGLLSRAFQARTWTTCAVAQGRSFWTGGGCTLVPRAHDSIDSVTRNAAPGRRQMVECIAGGSDVNKPRQ
ncbi:hypothetical protein MTO96_013958 [Rhipicephalus appendiculatus]